VNSSKKFKFPCLCYILVSFSAFKLFCSKLTSSWSAPSPPNSLSSSDTENIAPKVVLSSSLDFLRAILVNQFVCCQNFVVHLGCSTLCCCFLLGERFQKYKYFGPLGSSRKLLAPELLQKDCSKNCGDLVFFARLVVFECYWQELKCLRLVCESSSVCVS